MDHSSSRIVVYGAIVANLAITVSKFIAAYFTGSSAMVSEGIHSIVDTGNGGLLLLGMRLSQRPPDRDHPFGHGKELYFWSLLVAIVIFGIGGGMSIYEGIWHLRHPGAIENPAWNYGVLAFAVVFESLSFVLALRGFRQDKPKDLGWWQAIHRGKDPTNFTVLFEDTAALAGLVLAFAGVYASSVTGNPVFDGMASIAIGSVLSIVAVLLAYESKGLLLGESADDALLDGVLRIAEEDPAVEQARRPLTMHLAPHAILMNLDLRFRGPMDVSDLEAAINRIEQKIREAYPDVRRIFIEANSLRSAETHGGSDRPLS